jgi:Rrf2 family protein
MRITAKVDDAVRALIELARAEQPGEPVRLLKAYEIAEAQSIPITTLEDVLADLRRAGLARSQRGPDGGWRLAEPANQISVARVIRAVEGPLAAVQGIRPNDLDYTDDLAALQRMWIAVRASLRSVLERTTIANLRDGRLPRRIDRLTDDPDAWAAR